MGGGDVGMRGEVRRWERMIEIDFSLDAKELCASLE